MIRILYFASLREGVGISEERLAPGAALTKVADVTAELCRRGAPWSDLLGGASAVLVAVNQEMAKPQTPVKDGDEVAFFPPVTGG
jgi:molybdopterin synthase sulfur carrier subunit